MLTNYVNGEVIRQVINVKTGAVERTDVAHGVGSQAFVTSRETNAAVQLILDHPQLGRSLRAMYRQASGHVLTQASQICAQAGISFPDSATGTPLEAVTAVCQSQRCVQLFLPYDDTRFIDASNLVVDLSAGQLLWMDQGLDTGLNSPATLTGGRSKKM